MSDRPLGVSFYGAGRMAEAYGRVLAKTDDVALRGVADLDVRRARAVAERFGFGCFTDDFDQIRDDAGTDVVVVLLPHDLHATAVQSAFAAGKDVICEKPLCVSAVEARDVVAAAQRLGRRLYVKAYLRHARVNQRALELMAEGAIGAPYLMRALFASNGLRALQDPNDWRGRVERTGGGVLADSGYHLVDLACQWFGPVTGALATLRRSVSRNELGGEDVALVNLDHQAAVTQLTCVWADTSAPFRWVREVFGESGVLRLSTENGRDTLTLIRNHEVVAMESVEDYWNAANAAAIRHAIDAVRHCDDLRTAIDSLQTIEIVESCYRSARSGEHVCVGAEAFV